MAQSTSTCRKRTRNNNEEDGSEFTPLSKRINNLHIHSSCCSTLRHLKHHCVTDETNVLGYESPPWTDEANSSPSLMPPSRGMEDRFENCPPTPPEVSLGNNNVHTLQNHPNVVPPASGWISEEALSMYNPSLDSCDNPFYYESNKILFSLYLERMQRGGQNPY
ncbi:uncharacterized protein LOC124171726 [Ischnura elegans]|uniref:uncharacterized protein LOC124171726 n=1 Tax=Ischnura elegans TaxID=197161 RepID=UPI001ED89623|nr:uncharacterized protein LOC124171726 [Ischnura elegans]